MPPASGALGKPGDKVLVLMWHDSNIAAAAALNIDSIVDWIVDGIVDRLVDLTPPGGALLFDLWRPRDGSRPFVRL